jgi:hypothetical protein
VKQTLIIALLSALLAGNALAGTTGTPGPEAAVAAAGATVGESPETAVRDTGERIRDKVLNLVERAVDASDRLSAEEKDEIIEEIRDARRDVERDRKVKVHVDSDAGLEWVVAPLAVLLIFGTPIMLVVAILYAGYRKRRLVHETISLYLKEGKDLPPEIMQQLQTGSSKPGSNLQKGLILCGTGLGIVIALALMGFPRAASVGLIPLFIGLAQLLIWKLEQREPGSQG